MRVIQDLAAGLRAADEHFAAGEYADDPFFLQDRVVFTREYRILMVDGQSLGIVEKILTPGVFAANAALGATFQSAHAPEVVDAVLPMVSGEGVLGVDVGVDASGELHILEAEPRARMGDVRACDRVPRGAADHHSRAGPAAGAAHIAG